MSSTLRVDRFLKDQGVAYATLRQPDGHRHTRRDLSVAVGERMLKTLLLVDDDRHALAVIPNNRHIDLVTLNRHFLRGFRLGTPDDAARLYPGLPRSLLLPAGIEAQVEIFVDQLLVGLREIVIETADRSKLVRIEGEDFSELLNGAWCGRISRA